MKRKVNTLKPIVKMSNTLVQDLSQQFRKETILFQRAIEYDMFHRDER